MALKNDVARLVERAEERLFEELDSLAHGASTPPADVVAVLEAAHETDLAEKYENWLALGDDA